MSSDAQFTACNSRNSLGIWKRRHDLLFPATARSLSGADDRPPFSKPAISRYRWRPVAGCVMLALLSALLVACSSSIEAIDVRAIEFDVPPDVDIVIDSGGGSVLLRGEPGRETVAIAATLHSFASTGELAQQQVSELTIEWKLVDGSVAVDFAPPQAPAIGKGAFADFELVVPIDASITVATDDGRIELVSINGAIAASGRNDPIIVRDTGGVLLVNGIESEIIVSGSSGEAIFAATTEGDLTFSDVGGLIEAETQEGDIRYRGRPSGGSNRLVTHAGDLHVSLPADADLIVDVSARHGFITADLPLDGDLTGNSWTATLNDLHQASRLELTTWDGMISIEPWEDQPR